jgi:uncharacterized membrane protein YkvA (DUF1232 family)
MWRLVLALAVAVVVGGWLVLAWVARRIPPGSAREVVRLLPDCVTLVRRLRRDPRVPGRVKLAVALAALWVLSPIDLVPEFLPVIGPLDDAIVVILVLRWAARRIPAAALDDAWPGERALLGRIVGRRAD